MFIVAPTAPAQQTVRRPGANDKDEHGQRATQGDVPIVGQMVKVLTEKLDLTGDQQARIISAHPDVLFERIQRRGREIPPLERDAVSRWFEMFQAPTPERRWHSLMSL
jgi:hypothetical protein